MAKVVALTDIKHNGEEFKGRVLGMEDDVQVVLEEGDTLPADKFSEEELQALIDAGSAKEVASAKAEKEAAAKEPKP